MMKILSWNIRGLGHPSKVAALGDLILFKKPRIILLQETKQGHKEMSKVIEQQRQYKGNISEARGASGGVATIWNQGIWNCISETVNRTGSKQLWKIKQINKPLSFTTSMCRIIAETRRVVGMISKTVWTQKKTLTLFWEEHDLMDVPPKNRRYTWNNRKMGTGNIMERLDKILINVSLLSDFSVGYVGILTCSTSDHFPITLTLENHGPLGPIPFRYSSLWNDIPAVAHGGVS
eukprot:PITA_36257